MTDASWRWKNAVLCVSGCSESWILVSGTMFFPTLLRIWAVWRWPTAMTALRTCFYGQGRLSTSATILWWWWARWCGAHHLLHWPLAVYFRERKGLGDSRS
jgi:hypothetical protein